MTLTSTPRRVVAPAEGQAEGEGHGGDEDEGREEGEVPACPPPSQPVACRMCSFMGKNKVKGAMEGYCKVRAIKYTAPLPCSIPC